MQLTRILTSFCHGPLEKTDVDTVPEVSLLRFFRLADPGGRLLVNSLGRTRGWSPGTADAWWVMLALGSSGFRRLGPDIHRFRISCHGLGSFSGPRVRLAANERLRCFWLREIVSSFVAGRSGLSSSG
jgi:hypothetical protein